MIECDIADRAFGNDNIYRTNRRLRNIERPKSNITTTIIIYISMYACMSKYVMCICMYIAST